MKLTSKDVKDILKIIHTYFYLLFWACDLYWSLLAASICWGEIRIDYGMNTKRMWVNTKLLTCKIGICSNVWKPTFVTRVIAKVSLGNVDTDTHKHTQTYLTYLDIHTDFPWKFTPVLKKVSKKSNWKGNRLTRFNLPCPWQETFSQKTTIIFS